MCSNAPIWKYRYVVCKRGILKDKKNSDQTQAIVINHKKNSKYLGIFPHLIYERIVTGNIMEKSYRFQDYHYNNDNISVVARVK